MKRLLLLAFAAVLPAQQHPVNFYSIAREIELGGRLAANFANDGHRFEGSARGDDGRRTREE